MHSKRVVSLIMTLGLLAGSLTSVDALSTNTQDISKNEIVKLSNENTHYDNGGPADLPVANEEKIIEMLKREGKLDKNASFEEANEAFTKYMNDLSKNNKDQPTTKKEKELKLKENKSKNNNQKQAKASNEITEINVLTVLVEFDDYKHNQIKPEESDMYYEQYEKDHYEEMMFGENGYKGPNGANLKSLKQYYEEQSGGTLKINGKVTDWYTVPETAKYYGESIDGVNDIRPKELIEHALKELGKDKSIDLSEFDKIDRYDKDNDGNYNEPDGVIDHLMVIHAGMGEDAGGGSLGSDAIWSHRWNLNNEYKIPGTEYSGYDYTTVPEDGAVGVFAHELGHDLGMPDEYDTQSTSSYSEPIGYWSLMSSGSWAGKVPGTEPTGISPYSKQLMQNKYGGNWQNQTVIEYEDLTSKGTTLDLKQASETGEVIRVNLPDRETEIVKPYSGENMYWGGKGKDENNLKNSMNINLDLANTNDPVLTFKTWYDIESGWDFASVQVREVGSDKWEYVKGNISSNLPTDGIIVDIPQGVGITGTSNGWVDAQFSLKGYEGKNIELKIDYEADFYTYRAGIYIDDIAVVDEGNILVSDNAEEKSLFELNGFEINNGKVLSTNYYLIEWRNHKGIDEGLKGINTWYGNTYEYDPGMVVWYVNDYYSDNWTGVHPGGGYLSVVDADQKNIPWHYYDEKPSSMTNNRYQMHDAAFSSKQGSKFELHVEKYERVAIDKYSSANPKFSAKKDFTNPEIPQLGVDLPDLGLEVKILKQAKDNSGATINISKK
jgi:immune inhibitor A